MLAVAVTVLGLVVLCLMLAVAQLFRELAGHGRAALPDWPLAGVALGSSLPSIGEVPIEEDYTGFLVVVDDAQSMQTVASVASIADAWGRELIVIGPVDDPPAEIDAVLRRWQWRSAPGGWRSGARDLARALAPIALPVVIYVRSGHVADASGPLTSATAGARRFELVAGPMRPRDPHTMEVS